MSGARERRELAIAAGLIGVALAAGTGAVAGSPTAETPTAENAAADAASAPDIRDIRLPGAGGPRDRTLAILVGAGLVALTGGAYLLWRRRRRHPLRSFERALQQLEAAHGLLQAGRANEYCVAVSRIVRSYIEAGFRIPITQRTTEEFVVELDARLDSPLRPHRARLAEFLQRCDAAKFAGAAPTAQTLESLHRSALGLVRETTAEAHDAVPAT